MINHIKREWRSIDLGTKLKLGFIFALGCAILFLAFHVRQLVGELEYMNHRLDLKPPVTMKGDRLI